MATKSATTIPNSEADFLIWSKQFVSQVSANPELYFLEADRVTELETELAQYQTAFDDAVKARDESLAATRHKTTLRKAFENNTRVAAKMIQANDKVTDADREAAGVHVAKHSRTPVSVPTTFPVGFVMATDRLEHTLSFSDSDTPTRRARPAGATGCEVYLFVGDDTPQSASKYSFRMLATRSPQRITFTDEQAGKTANYLLRWVNSKGENGPWSQIISATIPAV
ncbi:hypothetical protein [Mariniblastus fucicola]|uniref:Uncharacterized protein n=1 Tax=Mariniblastus fucicola TaxID=980251 RepID=A0A5B9PER8_9BACT|nr:hypothetical protein [Mariniblastus fucicola]QEG21481.1 hypothetical protein MFFC18_13370 [Mariniblastus fucicola]